MFMLLLAVGVYLDSMLQDEELAIMRTNESILQNAAEAATTQTMAGVYHNFIVQESFVTFDATYASASTAHPIELQVLTYPNGATVTASVTGWTVASPTQRNVTIRSTAVLNGSTGIHFGGASPQMYIDQTFQLALAQSPIFDYMEFADNKLQHNAGGGIQYTQFYGDIRSNGDLLVNGSIMDDGSATAAVNPELVPENQGLVSGVVEYDTDASYAATAAANPRIRPLYDPSVFGNPGSTTYNQIGVLSYVSTPAITNGEPVGAYRADSTGAYAYPADGTDATLLTSQGTNTVPMPIMPSTATDKTISANYTDTIQSYADGTTNPNYGKGAYVKVWNTTSKKYVQLSTNGYVSSSALMVGTAAHPVLIHGPVTVQNDVVIKGYVSGQGTLDAGRNVHVIGSVMYSNPPNFQSNNPTTLLADSEKADMVGYVAQESIFFGRPDQNPEYIMSPPWTKARVDENGNPVPAYNGYDIDAWGIPKYESLISNATIDPIATPVNEIDGLFYSNHYLGGTFANAGGAVNLYGSIIDEDSWELLPAMTGPWGGWHFHYDPRIKSRGGGLGPIIDLHLPGSPTIQHFAWDRGAFQGG